MSVGQPAWPAISLGVNEMSNVLGRLALLAVSYGALGSLAHAGDLDIGLTIRGEVVPGVYGRVDLGGHAPPPVVYARPMVIEPVPPGVVVAPLYLHVPPEHAHDWRRHCHEYHACNRPVYFVRSREYSPNTCIGRSLSAAARRSWLGPTSSSGRASTIACTSTSVVMTVITTIVTITMTTVMTIMIMTIMITAELTAIA